MCYRRTRRYTRLIEQKNLPVLHAPLYPNGRTQETFMFVRAADGQFAREQMLARALPAAQNPFPHYPIMISKGGMGACPHD